MRRTSSKLCLNRFVGNLSTSNVELLSNFWQKNCLHTSNKDGNSSHQNTIRDFNKIPGPKGLPLIGNTWRYLPVIGQYNRDTILRNGLYNFKRYGPIVREQITGKLVVLHLFDPNDIERLFRQEELFMRTERKYPYRRSHRALLKYRLDRPDKYNDGGLFPENGENWHKQRKKFQQILLSKSNVSNYIELTESITIRFIRYLQQNRDVDSKEVQNLQKYLYEWSMENSLKLILNTDIDYFDDKHAELIRKLIQANHDALESIAKTETSHNDLWKHKPDKCPHYKKLVQSQEILHDFVIGQIKSCQEARCDKLDEKSLLSKFLNLKNADDKDITSMTLDLTLAGLHTTSYTVAFVLYHLAQNPQVQEELREEILSMLPIKLTSTLNGELLEKMTFLKDCVKESMRLQPLSIGTGRLIDHDGVVIRNYKIPKNIMVITHNQIACRNEDTFKDALEFRPHRWQHYRMGLPESRPNPFALLPFGYGARMCIGRRFAELQIYSLVAHMIRNFKVICQDRIETKNMLINVPSKAITMKLIDIL